MLFHFLATTQRATRGYQCINTPLLRSKHQWYPKWIEGVLDIAKEYEWTGNIREFHNF